MSENSMLAILVFYPFLGALAVWLAGRKKEEARDYLADFVAISEFALMLVCFVQNIEGGRVLAYYEYEIPEICGFGLHFVLEGFRYVYGLIAAFMWMMTTILSREYLKHHANRNRFYLFLLLTLGATMGVFLSADLYTTFVFFEIMSFTSYVWVAQEETKEALQAAATYLAVAIIGGLVMLMGIFLLYHELGTLRMDELLYAAEIYDKKSLLYGAGICLLVGFGAKAGAFPLHIWLPKAHPAAPAPASALLSGILTKTGVFGMLVVSSSLFWHDLAWGELMLGIGVITMFLGALLAVFSIDFKRTLACSSMSQIGFIMVGIGMQGMLGEHNGLAVHGTLLHMVNHSLIKLVLFMAAGVIFMNTHALDLNEIRGFGRKKPLLKGIFLIGALAIGGIPFFGGYISKTLLHESIVEYGGGSLMQFVEVVFLCSGGLTIAYMTKIFVAVFVEKNAEEAKQKYYDSKTRYMNGESGFALTASAVVLFLWGLFPHTLMDKAAMLGEEFMNYMPTEGSVHEVAYFSLTNLKGALISIVFGVLVYLFVVRKLLMRSGAYVDRWPKWLDVENLLYRPVLLGFLPFVGSVASRICDTLTDMLAVILRKTFYRDSSLPHERSEGNPITDAVGHTLNFFQWIRNHLWGRKKPVHKNYVHLSASVSEEFRENAMIIQRSLSFGLLMFGIGLMLTLIYIIWC